MEASSSRRAICEALKAAAPGAFDSAMRDAFLRQGSNIRLAELGLDSLARMEFCIAIELSTGLTLLPPQLAELDSTDAIECWIREKLG